mgnify:CR=1 FL=1
MGAHRRLGAITAALALAACCLGAPSPAVAANSGGTVQMYRLYNPYSGEHFYTGDADEKDDVVRAGWHYEGIGWVAPGHSDTPVYRLYNRFAGDHHYTKDARERADLVRVGWADEGVGWYSDDNQSVPLYRQYNPYAKTGTHNYTTDRSEHNKLISLGWRDESVGWHGVQGVTPYRPGTGTSSTTPAGQVDPVYVTKTGEKFHRQSCPSTSGKATSSLLRVDALRRGLEACKVCRP